MNQTEKCLSFLWAKKKEQSGQFFWLPLTLHLKDTMGVMEFLWHHWVSEGQKEIISRTLSDTGEVAIDIACRLACFLAGIHDFGKCTPCLPDTEGLSKFTRFGYSTSESLGTGQTHRHFVIELGHGCKKTFTSYCDGRISVAIFRCATRYRFCHRGTSR